MENPESDSDDSVEDFGVEKTNNCENTFDHASDFFDSELNSKTELQPFTKSGMILNS